MVRIASFNVENLFSRPKVFKTEGWQQNQPIFDAYYGVNELMAHPLYTDPDKAQMKAFLVTLEIYYVNAQGAVRKNPTRDPNWAWMRKNRGTFDREPQDATKDVEIVATGRDEWTGWVELAKEATNEVGTRMTAQVMHDLNADIQAVVEAEDRPALIRFNEQLLGGLFGSPFDHVMLVDGNDDRGIDVGLLTRSGFEIQVIRSNVDVPDPGSSGQKLFSRDCADYSIITPNGSSIRLLVNHFKSQSGGGGDKRHRQSDKVRDIVDGLVAAGEHAIVLGDFNEGSKVLGQAPVNLPKLFDPAGPLTNCWDLPGFVKSDSKGSRDGSFDDCSIRNRLDYILLSPGLVGKVISAGVFRKGLWGTRKTRPDKWETYPEMTKGEEQASDHAAVYVDLNI